MRTLQLTHEQIELIQRALNHACSSQIAMMSGFKHVLSDTSRSEIKNSADKYDELVTGINSGDFDV